MSADNGIYILFTKEGEYRVIHAQAIDNLNYDIPKDWDYNPKELVAYFKESPIFYEEKNAFMTASDMLKNLAVCEYGIQFIRANKIWEEYLNYVD